MFCCTLLYVHSSIAIILMGKRELVALLNSSSWCLVMVEWVFIAVPWGCLRFVIVVFPDHTHLQFLRKIRNKNFTTGDWSTDCEKAFQTLKAALTSPPILGYPDMNKSFILSTDSSGSAIGYREFVVAYGGRALRPDEK